MTTGWKFLTHDLRPPVRGGDPVFDGALPCVLPTVRCDQSDAECSYGWNFLGDIQTGFSIAGMWKDGRPRAVFAVEANDAIRRGDKWRAPQLTLTRRATDAEIQAALLEFSKPFGEHRATMANEQWLWWQALGRPQWDKARVESALKIALDARGLGAWTLDEKQDARAARAARAASRAWDAWTAWTAWDAWAAWDAWDARDARDAWDARAAWDALTLQFTARSGWISLHHDCLTVGIRDAYLHGLEIAAPGPDNALVWAMSARPEGPK